MGLIVDTGIFVFMDRKLASLSLDDLGPASELAVSAVTISELLVGAHRADSERRRHGRRAFADRIEATLVVLPFIATTAHVHAKLAADLQVRGQIIGAHDLIIAATALEHGHSVLTTTAASSSASRI